MKFSCTFLLVTLLACATNGIFARKAIIIDPVNTVFEVDTGSFFSKEIGFFSTMTLAFGGNNPFELQEKTFNILDGLGTQTEPAELAVREPKGRALPQIFSDFLSNKISAEDAAKKAKEYIRKHMKKGTERDLIESITAAIFNPEKIVYHTKMISKGSKLVEDCANKHGKNNLFVLGNLSKETIIAFFNAKHMQPLMQHFPRSNIFVSGVMKQLLPQPSCFEKLLKQHGLKADECVFITSMPYHAQTAKKLGIKTVLIENADYKKARQELAAFGAL